MSPSGDLEAVTRAALLAARAHADQTRKGRRGIPYINHPLEVAHLVAEDGAATETVIAALLHDVVEDSATALPDIERDFGRPVAELVEALTDAPAWEELPRPERKRLQAGHMPEAPSEARRIKIADQLSNLRDIAREPEAWSPDDAATYIDGAEHVVAACRGVSPGLEAAFDAVLAEAMQKIGGAP
ncbi:HD domain-containing protein [Histidinibacterium aquaticum]|uniref:Bifunctional (P)ppGpp synthetase/guanosine-3',5'-bis(Diphosphate) 3'-pyrophosphohydrolase n=1 Tax=Histidinibacterium aquaticum TaxID=2613962 RepID=A0A5J5GL42_9RHOB|nr:HD domain-containing protein [Histidinibacterium aquaticum]KAA9008192.1 bifunctional (p)ppGpp synthetase/guanosine-3',5'-bis(diphosphate) 3'-pyrophosphohydrolase [Histidinibacterium aquaticum]